ncbi:hypothetical protein H0G86_001654 [Trichoderma simmonsii]|uniref:Uncharacterized protein n=1 Tax=Trichoderma simmonsii TaxID=1491479 RepID=A0A8G0L530_9HYPO|nr:hypothetical protein H0G86_001654 [Trichoderma simmonsii]
MDQSTKYSLQARLGFAFGKATGPQHLPPGTGPTRPGQLRQSTCMDCWHRLGVSLDDKSPAPEPLPSFRFLPTGNMGSGAGSRKGGRNGFFLFKKGTGFQPSPISLT